ncbi:DSD1 family PLP-dependent enzyme [Glacieibacterium sp.]|uniref:DSD1 family PLP-dependent enzyme n=1 Tax=Glacieibacterium sp. TaxID=2860237 RepID=UPI003B00DEB9
MTDEELHGHLIGRQGSRRELNTPVLIVDLGALTRNIDVMAGFIAKHDVKLRPHAKTHKSPEIARRQIAAGAIGACCAKLGEAEVLAAGGITGLLITSPVVSPPAIERLAALNARTVDLSCVVDNPVNVAALGRVCDVATPLRVLIDIDPGMKRTGVASPEAAVALLAAIRAQPSLVYAGVQFYCGSIQPIADFRERAAAMEERADYLRTVIAALTEAGGAPGIVTGGGTGTHQIDPGLGVFTELQAGSYVFMDSQYLACELTGDDAGSPLETSLMIDARVISANVPGIVTIDAGIKAFATDAASPIVLSGAPAGSTYTFMGDEHGAVSWEGGRTPVLGEIVTLGTPHCDPTVNLYDTYHVVAGDTLRALWPVAARGRSR